MRFDDLKAALGPSVQNLDALYAAFVSETKSDDVARFLDHLRSKGVLSEDALRELAQRDPSGTLARQRPEPGKGRLAGPTMTTEMLEEDDGSTPIGASARDVANRYVTKNEQGRAAPRPAGPPKATAVMAPPKRDDPPGAPPPPPGVRSANPAPVRVESPKARTPSLPPRPNPTEAGGTPDDVPGRGYKFVGKIGEGAMGEVLIAKDLDLHRTVAYKVMSAGIADQPSLAGKFYGEAQITAQLDHPNIVPVYALARSPDGTLSYTMKRIRGYTFEKFIENTREQYKARKVDDKHTLTARLEMFLKVCDAMHYAHSRGVVHRDLKPENIMVGAFGEVYVMDWGIARLMPVEGAGRDDLVLVEGYQEDETPPGMEPDDDDDDDVQGVIIGTPQYMSPEQAFGRKDLDGRSDQYALGLILWELISLKQAVTGKTAQKIVLRQQDAEKDKLQHAFGEAIPPELRAILQKATAKKREDRYADTIALGDDIRRYLRGEAVLAKRDSLRQAVMRWVGRHRELTLMAVFALFSLTTLTVFASVGYQLWSSAKAREHEQAMSQLVTSTGAQGALIDSYFARYEGLLGTIAASAAEMLIRGDQTRDAVYWAKDFDTEGKQPPDLGASQRYKIPISIEHPVFLVPPKVQPDLVAPTFQRLTPMQRYFKRVQLMSHPDPNAPSYTPKRADRLIRDIGVPIAWVSLGLANGGYVGYPGHGGYADNYDPRERPWYKLAEKERETLWGAPYIDPAGLGLLLPCATSIYDEDDKFLGVASVQLPFDFIIDQLLGVDQLPPGAESFLVDDDGLIVVRSSEKGKTYDTATLRNRTIRMPEFPVPDVVEAIKDRESGKLEVYENGQSDLVLYNRMNSLGWYYVVRGEASALLAASKK